MPPAITATPEFDFRICATAFVCVLGDGLLPGTTLPRTGACDDRLVRKSLLETTIWVPEAGDQSASSVRLMVVNGRTFSKIGRAHSELQSLMRISYAVFCLKKKKKKHTTK